jgi:hypothetical protein
MRPSQTDHQCLPVARDAPIMRNGSVAPAVDTSTTRVSDGGRRTYDGSRPLPIKLRHYPIPRASPATAR